MQSLERFEDKYADQVRPDVKGEGKKKKKKHNDIDAIQFDEHENTSKAVEDAVKVHDMLIKSEKMKVRAHEEAIKKQIQAERAKKHVPLKAIKRVRLVDGENEQIEEIKQLR